MKNQNEKYFLCLLDIVHSRLLAVCCSPSCPTEKHKVSIHLQVIHSENKRIKSPPQLEKQQKNFHKDLLREYYTESIFSRREPFLQMQKIHGDFPSFSEHGADFSKRDSHSFETSIQNKFHCVVACICKPVSHIQMQFLARYLGDHIK